MGKTQTCVNHCLFEERGGAVVGAGSYVVRSLHGWWVAKQHHRAELASRLHSLAALLRTKSVLSHCFHDSV